MAFLWVRAGEGEQTGLGVHMILIAAVGGWCAPSTGKDAEVQSEDSFVLGRAEIQTQAFIVEFC